ncbi:MAG: class I mannose-6-phosphate isomerase [Bryobacterales bacterium]|nr:class I mannose-6-phosphate isomerase [Bryobacterales bacterium]
MSVHSTGLLHPFRVLPRFLEKVWGSQDLSPWFQAAGKVGEAWFTDALNQTSLPASSAPSASGTPGEPGVLPVAGGSTLTLGQAVQLYQQRLLGTHVQPAVAANAMFPLLVKFLFPTEKLSVQVHPADDYARVHENSLGKTEMWHVLRAEPGASVAAGFTQPFSQNQVRDAALDGSIEGMLRWWPVSAGDSIYIPAGTVHAIGPGLVLCEIQQASDVTYRLYDYGRPRELHLPQSLAVAHLDTHSGPCRPQWLGQGRTLLAEGPYFRTEKLVLDAGRSLELRPDSRRFAVWIALDGVGTLADQPLRGGDVFVAPATGAPYVLAARESLTLLYAVPPVN